MTLDDLMDAFTIRLWLAIRLPNGDADTLYTRDIRTAHTPRRENSDVIHLWPGTDDVVAASWYIKQSYLDGHGRYNVDLIPLVVDPDPETARRLQRTHYRLGAPWRTDVPGQTVHALLEAAGWTEWDGS